MDIFSNFDQNLDQKVEDNSNLQLTKQATVQPSRTTTTYIRSSVHYAPLFVSPSSFALCIVKIPLVSVVLVPHKMIIVERIGFLKILLLRVHPSRFSGNPNRATRPVIMVCLLPWVHPGVGGCPRRPSICQFDTFRPGMGVLNIFCHSAFTNENKKVSVLYVFFCIPPHIRTEPEPFNYMN